MNDAYSEGYLAQRWGWAVMDDFGLYILKTYLRALQNTNGQTVKLQFRALLKRQMTDFVLEMGNCSWS